jgi:protein-L-isoaspartate(D-aspartate) O-methyltransferase
MHIIPWALLALTVTTRCTGQENYVQERDAMVRDQLEARDIDDRAVLAAMRNVRRHEFVPMMLRLRAYADHPLPIGNQQTISQPYIVALMTQLAEVSANDTVLEVGTGSGYQAAVLAEIVDQVYTIMIIPVGPRSQVQSLRRIRKARDGSTIERRNNSCRVRTPNERIKISDAPPRTLNSANFPSCLARDSICAHGPGPPRRQRPVFTKVSSKNHVCDPTRRLFGLTSKCDFCETAVSLVG